VRRQLKLLLQKQRPQLYLLLQQPPLLRLLLVRRQLKLLLQKQRPQQMKTEPLWRQNRQPLRLPLKRPRMKRQLRRLLRLQLLLL
jgi:hypothetical protein